MTNEERDIITRFIERAAGSTGGGSVPASGAPLPPVDAEADALIAELFSRHPEARYRITQMAFVQEHALAEAQNRINQLQYQLASTRQAAAGPPASRGGFFSGLFGGGAAQPWNAGPAGQASAGQAPAAPPPQPTYAPGYQPGMFQRGGSGFLGSALTTAAGVAGGVVMGNALMSLFSPHAAMGGNFAGPAQETIVNQTIYDAPSPWTDPGAAAGGSGPGADPWAGGQAGQNFDPSQGGFDPSPGGIGGGFDPSQGGFDPTQAGFDPSQGGFDPGQDSFDPGSFGGDDDTDV